VDDIALRLRHLLPFLIADQRMDVDVAERHVAHELEAHHDHARDPEEKDIEAGDEHRRRIEALQIFRLLRPAERRERPQARGEPGIEDVWIAHEFAAAADRAFIRLLARDDRLRLFRQHEIALPGLDDVTGLAGEAIPGGNLVAPPNLPRDRPV